jgi:hypothetical protein
MTASDAGNDGLVACRALLVVDNEAIRRRLELELQEVREAIERAEEEINRHETLDLPPFRQWMAVECSDLLTERRLIEEKIWGLRARLAAIQGLAQHGIKNVAAAFFWFQEIRENERTIPPYVQRAWAEVTVGRPEKQRAPQAQAGGFDEGSQRQDAADWDEDPGNSFLEEDARGTDLELDGMGRISRHKSLYRKIALLLHPDLAGVLTKQELELWYQAQRAYEERDIVALETILARCDRVGTNSLTLSELHAFVQQANSSLATLRLSITGLALLPSWRFLLLNSTELKERLRSVRRELEGLIRGLLREAAMMENELTRIEERAERWVKRRKGEGKQLALGF